MTRMLANLIRAGAKAGALAMLLGSAGCNPFAMYQHRHTGMDFHGERHISYYHYPHGSWFVPKHQRHHCPVVTEQPFHGFSATCWTKWPEPWQPCPPPGMHPHTHGIELWEEIHPGSAPEGVHPPRPDHHSDIPPAALPVKQAPASPAPAIPKIAFQGKFGFSTPEDAPSAVAIELPANSESSAERAAALGKWLR
jgi:hypothetical protein